ncbi:MAG: type II toxin-antitoxin system PemK/MazF family toxin [Epsilonproteobacteria bacterium]|nr:MAG: type II toxin-antitoxin system PemK/MazF family toxin [Campylobacterota bacterium]
MQDNYDKWNEIKKDISEENIIVGYKNRDIFYMKMGENIGFEQNGKGKDFVRPVVVIKGFNENMFFGVPLSTKIKDGKFYYTFEFKKENTTVINNALLSQMKLFSTKRLLNKIGIINQDDFKKLKIKFKKLLD